MATHGDDNHNARRKFLTRSATLVAAGAALPVLPALARNLRGQGNAGPAGAWPSAAALPVRRNINGPNGSAAAADLRAAISAMMALPPTDPRNWYRQAMIHVLDCPHENAWFFPWHQGYLYWFERIARELTKNPSFALPYWDWTSDPSMPEAFFRRDLLDTQAQGFIHDWPTFDRTFRGPMEAFWGRRTVAQTQWLQMRGYTTFETFWAAVHGYFGVPTGRSLSAGNRLLPSPAFEAVSMPSLVNALAPSAFADFGGSMPAHHSIMATPGLLESQPHNMVHDAVGGFMGDMMSATDPVFWLHHCNIDRLWDIWMQRQGVHAVEGSHAWLVEPFLFFSAEDGIVRPVQTANHRFSSVAQGFSYEASQPIPAALSRPANAAWPAASPCRLQSTNLPINGSILVNAAPGEVACNAFLEGYPTAIEIELDYPDNPSAWHFKVEIKIDGDPSSAFEHCGYASFFGSMGAHPPGHAKHRGQLKIGIADGMKKCLAGARPGAQQFTIAVRAQRAGSSLPPDVLQVHRMDLISL